ncbi:MAG: tRNA 2-thiocytidine biosynthesis TtcA family protein [Patescibacteria group bacterium]
MSAPFPLPRSLNRKIWRAVTEFGLIAPGDRILAGFSGGKDSAFLLYALRSLQLHNRLIPFTLEAVTLDAGFNPAFPPETMKEYAARLGVAWHLIPTKIAALLAESNDPCARCSFFRRGAILRFARERGFNAIAFAHHHDDAVETFLMSILYSGKIQTFLPRTELDGGLSLIRPLAYLREAEIRKALPLLDFTPVPSGCPYEAGTQRRKTKDLLKKLCRENRFVYPNLAAAMRASGTLDLWPPLPGKEEMREIHRRFFGREEPPENGI